MSSKTKKTKELQAAEEWFAKARNEALVASQAIKQRLTPEELPVGDDLIVRLMAVFSADKTVPLPCILYAASKIYGMALQLGLESMQKDNVKVTIN